MDIAISEKSLKEALENIFPFSKEKPPMKFQKKMNQRDLIQKNEAPPKYIK